MHPDSSQRPAQIVVCIRLINFNTIRHPRMRGSAYDKQVTQCEGNEKQLPGLYRRMESPRRGSRRQKGSEFSMPSLCTAESWMFSTRIFLACRATGSVLVDKEMKTCFAYKSWCQLLFKISGKLPSTLPSVGNPFVVYCIEYGYINKDSENSNLNESTVQ